MVDPLQFYLRGVGPDHPALQVAMPLVSYHDGEPRCVGTAFAVAPGLAITAEHVVDDWRTYRARRDGYKGASPECSVVAFQVHEGRVYQWVAEEAYVSKSADIAFLRFARPAWWGSGPGQVQPPVARLNFNPPETGDEVWVFGFPESKIVNGILEVSPCECLARVREVALKSSVASRPDSHVELDGEMLGGMSGGPCFDRDWNVIGVNSKGWTFLDAPPISYMALLWPAMRIEIDLFRNGGFPAVVIL